MVNKNNLSGIGVSGQKGNRIVEEQFEIRIYHTTYGFAEIKEKLQHALIEDTYVADKYALPRFDKNNRQLPAIYISAFTKEFFQHRKRNKKIYIVDYQEKEGSLWILFKLLIDSGDLRKGIFEFFSDADNLTEGVLDSYSKQLRYELLSDVLKGDNDYRININHYPINEDMQAHTNLTSVLTLLNQKHGGARKLSYVLAFLLSLSAVGNGLLLENELDLIKPNARSESHIIQLPESDEDVYYVVESNDHQHHEIIHEIHVPDSLAEEFNLNFLRKRRHQ